MSRLQAQQWLLAQGTQGLQISEPWHKVSPEPATSSGRQERSPFLKLHKKHERIGHWALYQTPAPTKLPSVEKPQ